MLLLTKFPFLCRPFAVKSVLFSSTLPTVVDTKASPRPPRLVGRDVVLIYVVENPAQFSFESAWFQLSIFFSRFGLISYAATADYKGINSAGGAVFAFYFKLTRPCNSDFKRLSLVSSNATIAPLVGTYSSLSKSTLPLHMLLLSIAAARNSGLKSVRLSESFEPLMRGI